METSSSDEDVVILYKMWCDRIKQRKSVWVRDIYLHREQMSEYHVLTPQLLQDYQKFQNYYRMSQDCYNVLTSKIKPLFKIGNTNYRKSISFEERLAISLRFLANGESFASSSYRFRISPNHMSVIIMQMLEVLYNILSKEYLVFPKQDEWISIGEGFEKKKYFPNCIGALDGKHIRIQKPHNGGSQYFNYKSFHSIILLALVDSNYKFLMIDVGSYGRNSDGGVLENSRFGKLLKHDRLDLPKDKSIQENGEPLPYVIIGDEAFRLTEHVMKPYPRKSLDRKKRIYNYRLSYARQMVECTFGILVSKFRIFTTAIAVKPENVDIIVKCACVLHNMIRHIDKPEGETTPEELRSLANNAFLQLRSTSEHHRQQRTNSNQSTRHARRIRDCFANFFAGDGALEWQDQMIEFRDAEINV